MPTPNAYGHVRQSYVEKDRVVRNSTAAPMPGVDVMQGFKLSKKEFENVFLQAAERVEQSASIHDIENEADAANPSIHTRRNTSNYSSSSSTRGGGGNGMTTAAGRSGRLLGGGNSGHQRSRRGGNLVDRLHNNRDAAMSSFTSATGSTRPTGDRLLHSAGVRSTEMDFPTDVATIAVPGFPIETPLRNADDAARYADACRRMAATLQRGSPPDFDAAGELFEKAIDTRTRFGLHCVTDNADAHVEYAQNLSKRGLAPEAEYHLRAAADIFRILDARYARKYGDVLLYVAVVVDRQGRLAEAENFYRASLAVYRANKLSDDNVRVAIDSLSNNLRAQGRGDEVDTVIQRHFLGAPQTSRPGIS